MLNSLEKLLLQAISASLGEHRPVRVFVADIRQAVRALASVTDEQTIRWLGNDQRADCYGRTWHITLVARADEDTGLRRHLNRVTSTRVPFLPVGV